MVMRINAAVISSHTSSFGRRCELYKKSLVYKREAQDTGCTRTPISALVPNIRLFTIGLQSSESPAWNLQVFSPFKEKH